MRGDRNDMKRWNGVKEKLKKIVIQEETLSIDTHETYEKEERK